MLQGVSELPVIGNVNLQHNVVGGVQVGRDAVLVPVEVTCREGRLSGGMQSERGAVEIKRTSHREEPRFQRH